MSLEAVITFWQKVQRDPKLRGRVDGKVVPQAATSAAEFEGLARVARDSGYDCTPEELRAAEAVSRFWTRAYDDEEIQKKLLPVDTMATKDAVKYIGGVANQYGYTFTLEQLDIFTKAQVSASESLKEELSDKQLDGVAGGAIAPLPNNNLSSMGAFSPQYYMPPMQYYRPYYTVPSQPNAGVDGI